jgi:hypothetical protein
MNTANNTHGRGVNRQRYRINRVHHHHHPLKRGSTITKTMEKEKQGESKGTLFIIKMKGGDNKDRLFINGESKDTLFFTGCPPETSQRGPASSRRPRPASSRRPHPASSCR